MAFGPKNLTCTVLSMIAANIVAGVSRKKLTLRAIIVMLDLTAAFDNVDHQQLLHCTTTPTYQQQSVAGSTTICRTDEPKSIFGRKVKTEVVVGGVLSSALLNDYLGDFPTSPPNIMLIKYADDITIYTSGPVVADLINGLNIYLSQVLNYINSKN